MKDRGLRSLEEEILSLLRAVDGKRVVRSFCGLRKELGPSFLD